MSECYCKSGLSYDECCLPTHENPKSASSAEALMRARYSAFAANKVEFIDQTNIPSTTDFNLEDAKKWATESTWEKLEVLKTENKDDKTATVEFKAHFLDAQKNKQVHHEIGFFKKQDNTWFYTEGKIVGVGTIKRDGPKVGRNDPCHCGSGKKFKKCCGK